MKKSAFYSDVLFTFSLTAIFTLCFFRYLKISVTPAFILAVVCGILSATANGAWLQSKRKNLLLKKSDETKKQKLLLHLALLSDGKKTDFFQAHFAKSGEVKRFSALRLVTPTAFYFLFFRFKAVTADEVSAVFRFKSNKQKIILCNEADDSAVRLCLRLGVTLLDGTSVYETLKRAQSLPESYLGEEAAQDKRQRRRRLCFAKNNSKRFLISGALVLLSSLFTPFPYYYFIFGSALLLVAIVIRIFGQPKKTPSRDLQEYPSP